MGLAFGCLGALATHKLWQMRMSRREWRVRTPQIRHDGLLRLLIILHTSVWLPVIRSMCRERAARPRTFFGACAQSARCFGSCAQQAHRKTETPRSFGVLYV